MTTLDRRTFLALGAVLAAGCSSTRSSSGGGNGEGNGNRNFPGQVIDGLPGGTNGSSRGAITSVAMVGDSITEGSTEALTSTLAAAGVDDVIIEGKRSRRIEVGNGKGELPLSGIVTVYNLLAEGVSPDAWVMALGTNDVGSYGNADEYGALIDKITGMLPDSTPLVWVNTFRKQYLDDTILFNSVLSGRIAARGNATIADWFTVASAPDQNVLRADSLHPNDNGQLALSMLVLQALQQL